MLCVDRCWRSTVKSCFHSSEQTLRSATISISYKKSSNLNPKRGDVSWGYKHLRSCGEKQCNWNWMKTMKTKMFMKVWIKILNQRKRKKISTSKSFGGPYDNCEDEESWTGCSGFKRRPYLPLQRDRRFNSSWNKGFASKYSSCGRSGDMELCTSTNLPSSHQAVCYPTASSSSTYTAESSGENKQQCNSSHKPPAVAITKGLLLHSKTPSPPSRQKVGESKIENKDSKWNKFLTFVPNHNDYEAHDSSNYSDNTAVPYFTEALTDMGVDSEVCRYPLDGKTDSGALGRQKSVGDICVDGYLSSPTNQQLKASWF